MSLHFQFGWITINCRRSCGLTAISKCRVYAAPDEDDDRRDWERISPGRFESSPVNSRGETSNRQLTLALRVSMWIRPRITWRAQQVVEVLHSFSGWVILHKDHATLLSGGVQAFTALPGR